MTINESTEASDRIEYRFSSGPDPALSNFARLDEIQRSHRPYTHSSEGPGYWVFTDHDAILEGMQRADLFSSSVIVPIDPDPPYKWIPVMLDPPDHGKWRHVLGGYFSPGRINAMEAEQRTFARQLIEGVVASGRCDFYSDFAAVFPTTIFLQMMGMPISKLPEFMVWEDQILHATEDFDPTVAAAAMTEVTGYFAELIEERRGNPAARGDDIVSHAIEWEIDGRKPSDEELLSCMLLLFMAGLDTVAAALSYSLYHFATHPADRRRIVADPSRVPLAVEELLRAYPIVQAARKAVQDTEFHGCPIKKGEMVVFPLAMANRDPQTFPRGGTVDLDAARPRHIAFGAGPHRCLGSHLARQELTVALQEWHRLIPDYEIHDESMVTESTGGVYSLERLPLRWS